MAEFDPDAYLKTKTKGFDPDAYLSGKGVAPDMAPSKFDMRTLADVAKSGVSGFGQGVAGLVGLPGTISDALSGGLTAGMNYLTGADVQIPGSPGSGDALSQRLGNAVGGYHKPETVAGEYARTVGEFAPGMVMGPSGAVRRIASAVIPALTSEAAGQATKGTSLEPAARIATALLTPTAMNAVEGGAKSLARALSGTKAPSMIDAVAPTTAQHKQAGGALFDEVFKNPEKNVIISKTALSRLSDEVRSIAAEHGYDPALNKQAKVVISNIQKLPNQNSTLMGLENARRLANGVAMNRATSDGALSGKITKAITNFMDDLDDADIIGQAGSADLSGPSTLKNARAEWRTMKKSALIDNIINNAEITAGVNYTQAGGEQALQRGFANLAKNQKRMVQFSPDEQAAIKLAATGSAVQGALKFLGKAAIRGPVSASATTFLGSFLGPYGPMLLAGAGEAAKRGAASGVEANVDNLAALVRGGPSSVQKLAELRRLKMIEGLKRYGPAASGVLGYSAEPETNQ